MFRYIAFSWQVANVDHADVARRLEEALLGRGAWHSVFETPGHRVFVTGNARGVNDAYLLPANQGVILGRLFRRGMAAPNRRGDIDITDLEAQRITHSDGRGLIEQFWGRYVAFLPSWTGQARVLRDPTGTLPCVRIQIDGVVIVLSWLEDLFKLLDFRLPSVDWDAVAAHMVLGRLSGRETLLKGVTQVLPGELAPMTTDGSTPLQLWSAAGCARRASSFDHVEAARRLRATVADCVQSWASCYQSVVLRLSGGVDSAIVLSSLVQTGATSVPVCLNYYSPGTDSDERAYARLASQRHDATLIERTVDDGFRLDEVLNVARTALPANYIGSMGTIRTDAEVAAEHGADAVFNGAGGDQLFFEVRCTWPAADYLKLRGLDQGFLGATLDSAHLGHVSFWKALRQALKDRTHRGDPLQDVIRFHTLMAQDAMVAAAAAAPRFVHPCWLAAQDLPIGKFNQLGMLMCPFEYYNHHLGEAAAERVQPLMSQPLLELCLETPTFVLTHGGRGRGLARTAFADRIPAEIVRRRSKGGMENYIATVLHRNQDFARELLMDGLLCKQGLLDRPRVEAVLAGRPGSSATFTTEIHACIATEAWLRRATAPAMPTHA